MVKSGQPSLAKCAFHKSFKYTSYICLNCKLYFSLCMWIEQLWNKIISTSIEKQLNFQKNENEKYFSNSWPFLISKSVSADISCRVDLADLLKASYFHFNWLATIYLREVFPKNSGWEDPCMGKDVLILGRRIIGAPCTLIDWFRTSKSWFLHYSDRVTQDSSNLERITWTLVIRRGSAHSKISKTAMFNQRPTGSPILNIFRSNLLQWFYK